LRKVRETLAECLSLLGTQEVGVGIMMVVCGVVVFRLVERVDGGWSGGGCG
jgi:hypothetical protein